MGEVIPIPSKTEAEMVARLKELVGDQAFNDSPPIFGGSIYCLAEAARCYDDWAFSASCVMSRAALETAFLAYFTSRRTDAGWRLVKPRFKESGALKNRRFEYWYARARGGVRFTPELREIVRRVKKDGDRSAHYGQKLIERFWGQVLLLEKLKRRGKRGPVVAIPGLPSSLEAHRNLMGATEVLATLIRAKFAEVQARLRPK